MRYLVFSIFLFLSNYLIAQTSIDNVTFKQNENDIIVQFDLYGATLSNAFLYYSLNNGITWIGPLKEVSGDLKDINAGLHKTIRWDVLKETKNLIAENIVFKVSGNTKSNTFIDPRNNQIYNTVAIGSQIWFAENLNYKTTNSYCYDNIEYNCKLYGRLYTWNDAINACPNGWHLPSDDEWKKLEFFIGMSQEQVDNIGPRGTIEGNKMKSIKLPNGLDEFGFCALFGGYCHSYSDFRLIGENGYWWTSTSYDNDNAWWRSLDETEWITRVRANGGEIPNKTWGLSVRCIED